MTLLAQANEIFSWAVKQPSCFDGWEEHATGVAETAKVIAERCGMNVELTYVVGLLHDIGKCVERDHGKFGHPFTGYQYLMEQKLQKAARVALTHSFYWKEEVTEGIMGVERFRNEDERQFLIKFLRGTEYDDYDKLIQLVDNMVSWQGVMTVDDRFCDILMRHELVRPGKHLEKLYELKDYFDEKAGINLYELFRDDIIRTAINEPTRKLGWVEPRKGTK